MIVYAVLWSNYGDQGTDFEGVFATLQAAQNHVKNRSEIENDHPSNWMIKECKVQGQLPLP